MVLRLPARGAHTATHEQDPNPRNYPLPFPPIECFDATDSQAGTVPGQPLTHAVAHAAASCFVWQMGQYQR